MPAAAPASECEDDRTYDGGSDSNTHLIRPSHSGTRQPAAAATTTTATAVLEVHSTTLFSSPSPDHHAHPVTPSPHQSVTTRSSVPPTVRLQLTAENMYNVIIPVGPQYKWPPSARE